MDRTLAIRGYVFEGGRGAKACDSQNGGKNTIFEVRSINSGSQVHGYLFLKGAMDNRTDANRKD